MDQHAKGAAQEFSCPGALALPPLPGSNPRLREALALTPLPRDHSATAAIHGMVNFLVKAQKVNDSMPSCFCKSPAPLQKPLVGVMILYVWWVIDECS